MLKRARQFYATIEGTDLSISVKRTHTVKRFSCKYIFLKAFVFKRLTIKRCAAVRSWS